ncbi:RNase H2 complex component-like protein [Elsinoe australis]|uniref:Ribonuclease H2 subunit B n=1 Tax=Elsinoe australis TaxID=40998 RepID=A0A4U7B4Z1_9PEZI|nr:RNase H2 complex component-like protein [Elsinoe australis]
MRTRTTKKSQVAAIQDDIDSAKTNPPLPASSSNPPMLFILPEKRSLDARIVSLPNPQSGVKNRYFFDPTQGVYEFTKITATGKQPSSWLLSPEGDGGADFNGSQSEGMRNSYSIEDPGMFVATAVDPVFFLLPTLLAGSSTENKQLFVTLDDHLDNVSKQSEEVRSILGSGHVLTQLEISLANICDKVEAGDDSMFRINLEKLCKELLSKAERVVAAGLPPSMEQKFVSEALQAPTTLRTQIEMVAEIERESQDPEEQTPGPQSQLQSQTSFNTTTASASQDSLASAATASTAATSVEEVAASSPEDENIRRLLRSRTAFDFILSSYIQKSFHEQIRACLDAPQSPIDFTALDKRLAEIADMKKEAQTLRSLSDNISRKRMVEEDDEIVAVRAEKKRKREEEEAKKKAQPRGIKQLAKADTSGMKKMSSFFTKAAAKKATT